LGTGTPAALWRIVQMAKASKNPRVEAAARVKENSDVDMPLDDMDDMGDIMPDEEPMDEDMDVDMDMPAPGGLSPADADALSEIAKGRGKSDEEAAEIVEIVEEFLGSMMADMGAVEELPAPPMDMGDEEMV